MNSQNKSLFLSLFLLSVAVLTLEIAQMKLFAFSLQFFVIHIVLSIVLLGFGVGGTLYSITKMESVNSIKKIAGISLFLFPVMLFLTTKYFCWIAPKINIFNPRGFTNLLILVSFLTLPYLFAGLSISAIFTLTIDRIGISYFFNLAGSAIGCLIVFPLLRKIGMEPLILLICAISFFSYSLLKFAFVEKQMGNPSAKSYSGAILGFVLVLILIFLLPLSKSLFHFPPDANDQFSSIKRGLEKLENKQIEPICEFSRWDPAGKIEVYDFPGIYLNIPDPIPLKWYCQDSGAGSVLFNFGENLKKGKRFFEQTIYGFPYILLNKPKALIIGLGGGVDIQTALYFGATDITGVEINSAAVDAVGVQFNDFVGNIYHKPEVKIFITDGRTFIWKNKEKFDLIQMTGADTKSFWSSNALALNINYLYTVESFTDYLNSLTEEGILSITRFEYDLMRLATIGVETLRRMGVENPQNNIIITFQGIWGNILIKKKPFTEEEISILRKHIEDHNNNPDTWVNLVWFGLIGFGLDKPYIVRYEPTYLRQPVEKSQYLDYFRAVEIGEDEEFLDTAHNNFYPTTDDNPFFFMQARFSHIFSPQAIYLKIYVIFTILVLIISAFFCIGPLLFFKLEHLKTKGSGLLMIYFFALGVAYMFIEIGLMQKLTRFLGNPGYAVSIILFTLLLFSGLGSYVSNRFKGDVKLIVYAILVLAFYLSILTTSITPITNIFIVKNLTLRAIIVILLLAPLGFVMGIPFPTGLAILKEKGFNFIPWAVGVNGFASVLGSLTFILLVMSAGFRISILSGGLIYLIALSSILLYKKSIKS